MKNNKYLQELIELLLKIDSEELMLDFLEGILTPAELEDVPVRLQIVKMLKEGIPQREIAEKLGVGIGTITRGSREIKQGKFKSIKN